MSASQASEPTISIQGFYYSGESSHRQSATLRSHDGGDTVWLECDQPDDCRQLPLADIEFSPRIGNTNRYLHLPDDGVFETVDNDGVDELQKDSGQRSSRWIHVLENHLGLILIAVVVTAATVGASFVYGVPWASQAIADALPESVAEQVGDSTLRSLDELWLEPSTLSEERQQALQDRFAPFLEPVGGQDLEVVFRSSDAIGANAMALPNGTLIFTDDLVNLAEDDNELVAILAHEIGHVAHRHGMKGVVQSSLTTWLIVMMTGDISAFSDTTVAVPAILMSLAYSRDLEREADVYALETLQNHQIPTDHFANIMSRLVSSHQTDSSESDEDSRWKAIGDLLSSHPGAEERIEQFRSDSSDSQ